MFPPRCRRGYGIGVFYFGLWFTAKQSSLDMRNSSVFKCKFVLLIQGYEGPERTGEENTSDSGERKRLKTNI